jgi:hypothetical protein
VTGPEHYLEAERLLASITSQNDSVFAAKAQVHATLALAAATAMAGYDESGMCVEDFRDWDKVCGVTPGGSDG